MVVRFAVPNRGRDEQFATPGNRTTRLERALPQKIQLVFVECSLEAQQKAIVAGAGVVDRLLINQYGIDNTADLDELLPLAAIAREARNLTRSHGTNTPEANL